MMHDALEHAAATHGDSVALRFGEERWTFTELAARAGALAAHLDERGVQPGDRVALMMSNRPDFVASLYGISAIGTATVSLSLAWKALEADHAPALTTPVHAVADGDAVALLSTRLVTDHDSANPRQDNTELCSSDGDFAREDEEAVLDCAVSGIADERAGEVPVAAVQLDPEVAVPGEELRALVERSLATYEHLRHVVVVDVIPRLPSGKVLRRALRDEWAPALTGRNVGV